MANKKQHPALGKMPKAKGGSRRLDHPSCGSMPTTPNNRELSGTRSAGGKLHPSAGSSPRTKNPAPISYNTVGGGSKKATGW